jgi:hypothetical protein
MSGGITMTVFVLVREDQNDHGYIDTSITGIFREQQAAATEESRERVRARADGLGVEDDEAPDGEWQVSWKIEEHSVA